jgi:outer membrane protein OmpA-like peptidoglycan-associated protein
MTTAAAARRPLVGLCALALALVGGAVVPAAAADDPQPATGLTATESAYYTVDVTWTAAVPGGSPFDSTRVCYVDETDAFASATCVAPDTATSATITDLRPDRYDVWVESSVDATVYRSTAATFTIHASPCPRRWDPWAPPPGGGGSNPPEPSPGVPGHLHVASRTDHSLTLAWTAADGDDYGIGGYCVRYRVAASGDPWTETSTTQLRETIDGLAPATRYEYQAWAYDTLAFRSQVLTATAETSSAGDRRPARPPRLIGVVYFAAFSPALSARSMLQLRTLAARMLADGVTRVSVHGHTATFTRHRWTPVQVRLSRERAAAVAAVLRAWYAAHRATLHVRIVADGARRAVGSNADDAGRALNRRADIELG